LDLRYGASRLRALARSGKRWLQAVAPFSRRYTHRLEAEQRFFSGCQDTYKLPAIYNYWSNKHLRPSLERFGFSHPEALYCHYFSQAYTASSSPQRVFLSVGAGNCETELRLAEQLFALGHRNFSIECVELNKQLLDNASEAAKKQGLAAHIVPVCADFNRWTPTKSYDGVLANNSLHHVANLEGLLGGIRSSLAPTGFFVTCDMVGRNGHMRWPEALSIVHEYWRELPKKYTYNHLLQRYEGLYENWDCSTDGFEGIRAQDILPLLIEHFGFELFIPFANVVDPFIERTFGHNFDVSNAWDTAFIDRVHARDEDEIMRGAIKPTHILAAMCSGRPGSNLTVNGLTPSFCVRSPDRRPIATRPLQAPSAGEAKQDEVMPANGDVPAAVAAPNKEINPRFDFTDIWWCPQEPGWGLSLHQHRSAKVFATWLTYGPGNEPVWYSLQSGKWLSLSIFAGVLYATTGPPFDGPFMPSAVTTRQAGTATLEFTDQAHGTFTFTIDGKSGTKVILRMDY